MGRIAATLSRLAECPRCHAYLHIATVSSTIPTLPAPPRRMSKKSSTRNMQASVLNSKSDLAPITPAVARLRTLYCPPRLPESFPQSFCGRSTHIFEMLRQMELLGLAQLRDFQLRKWCARLRNDQQLTRGCVTLSRILVNRFLPSRASGSSHGRETPLVAKRARSDIR